MVCRYPLLTVLLGAVSACAGCASMHDAIDDTHATLVWDYRAKVAWHDHKDSYRNVPHRGDFRHGFLEGYRSVAAGGNGCPPLLPPRKYWSVHYENAEGREKTVAWFDGFSHGVLAAEMNGVIQYSGLVTSRALYDSGCQPIYEYDPDAPVAPQSSPVPVAPPSDMGDEPELELELQPDVSERVEAPRRIENNTDLALPPPPQLLQ